MAMSRCTCIVLVLLGVSFAVSWTVPVEAATTPPPLHSTSSIQRVRLSTACLRDQQCVFQTSGIAYRVLASALAITADITCSKDDCISDSQTCLCCDESADYLQELLQVYSEGEIKYQKLVADGALDYEIQEADAERNNLRQKLQQACSQLYCSDAIKETCEFIKCKPRLCNQTTTAPSTTATPTQSTESIRTTTTTAIASSLATSNDSGQSRTISTTPTTTSIKTLTTDASAAARYSLTVAAVVLGAFFPSVAAVGGVAVLVIFWWRRRRRKRGGRGNVTKCDPAQHTSTGTINHGFQDADNYAVISNVTNQHNHVYSITTSHQPEHPRALPRATDSLGYEIAFGTSISQKEYPMNSRLENSGEYYSPLRISDRETSMTDEKQQYAPLEMYQTAQNKTQAGESGERYTSLTHLASKTADAETETQSPSDYLELI